MRPVLILAVVLRVVSNDGLSVCVSDAVWQELLEFGAVLFGTAVNDGRRRYRDEVIAVVSGSR